METLDPTDWEAMRALAHRMVDDAIDYTAGVRERPVWQPPPDDVVQRLQTPAPQGPQDPAEVYAEFSRDILPYPMGNIHPRFWAWYMGNGTMMGALADFWAAIMNPNVGGGNHVAVQVEQQVINWMKEVLGFPADASGLLLSGGSMANFVALAVARHVKGGFDVRAEGLGGGPQLVVYASGEVHSCNQKAVELLGLGSRHGLHKVPVTEDFRLDIGALEAAIAADRAAGRRPICVIGSAGTVNTGAVDDLQALADLCAREGLWLHVDGAIGALAMLADSVRPHLRGIERADSVALDLHKWLHIPFEAGCVVIRDRAAHRGTFALTPEYLEPEVRGLAGSSFWFSDYGLQLTRQFRALKVWMSIKEHGLARLGRMMDRNVAQAQYLAQQVTAEPRLELLAPVVLDIVCFRCRFEGADTATHNARNKEILFRLQERGIAAPSSTVLRGQYCIRVAIANHRSTDEDFALLVAAVLEIAREVEAEADGPIFTQRGAAGAA
jgi:glutamate/tyrosine decarboxylase-like PLP-dependent enzyme